MIGGATFFLARSAGWEIGPLVHCNGPQPREVVFFVRSRVFGEMHCPKLMSESRQTS